MLRRHRLLTLCALGLLLCTPSCDDDSKPGGGSDASAGGSTGAGQPAGAGSGVGAAGAGAGVTSGGSGSGGTGAPTLDTFAADAAASVCQALFRCCDEASIDAYFLPYSLNDRLAAFAGELPPTNEADCRALLGDMIAITPFGDWIAQAQAGRVELIASAFASCRADLANASCGPVLWNALHDSTCFGFDPPAGGPEQRSMFARTAGTGQECHPIRDGVGASFYGTCDPTTDFCCFDDPDQSDGGCAGPFSEQQARVGTCQPVAALSAECSLFPPFLLCATGVSCDSETGTCIEESAEPLAVGDECVDGSFNLLGECQSSWCDLFGTGRCEPLGSDGAPCSGGYECVSGYCDGDACAPFALCVAPGGGDEGGSGGTGGAGSGSGAGGSGAGGGGADAETCATAPALSSVSVAQASTTYPHRVDGIYGTSNDYNPYQSATPSRPPGCSLVYDARGKEVVYAVTLDPGERLRLRYTPSSTSVRGGVYLLDACSPSATWPDYDGSGLCGDNEYAVANGIGYSYWYPVEWSWLYPAAVDGLPTSTHTFFLVLDEIDGEGASAFTLEWSITN